MIDALGSAATTLCSKLGESLPWVQKFDVPLEQVTTSSLEALKAFSLARKQNSAAAIPFYERAIELDAKFAEAYARFGLVYHNLSQPARANENITRAFDLREHGSEIQVLRYSCRIQCDRDIKMPLLYKRANLVSGVIVPSRIHG